jgi:dephospho-CoA kinase
MSIVIGLTGPIGCGKSTVAAHLATRGGMVIDADELAPRRDEPGRPTLPAIRRDFGDAVLRWSGRARAVALAAVVFDDPAALKDLEAIVHPAVRVEVEARLASPEAETAPFTVIEAIRLVEGGLGRSMHEVWLVVCDRPDATSQAPPTCHGPRRRRPAHRRPGRHHGADGTGGDPHPADRRRARGRPGDDG